VVWRLTERHGRLLAAGLGAACAAYFGLYAIATLQQPGPFRFGDFFALWSYGRVLVAHPAAGLYDPAALLAHQQALGMPAADSNPFPYPPSFLPALWPLGWLSYNVAYVAFGGGSFVLYLLAVGLAAPRPRLPLLLFAAVAPTTTLTLVAGQTGLLAAALFLGGMRLLPARPLLGGALLGLLAYKPQLGVLIPVALIAARQWQAIAAAVAAAVLMGVATSAAFGWQIWADWLAYLPAYADQFARESTQNEHLMPTLTANLRMLGVPDGIARAAQGTLALLAGIWVWRSSRNGLGPRATLVLATACFLATPHAFVYDLPLLTGALLLFVASRAHAAFSLLEVVALTLALAFPVVMAHAAVPLSTVCLGLLATALIAHPGAPAPAPL